jgi:Holliday junction DNA helicase RuvA
VIISANGIGYEIAYPNNYVVSEYGETRRLFLSHKVSEYGESLFGFASIEEKIIFEQLENLKGIGSKAIFTIMSILEIRTIADLQNISLDQLVKLPGVGKTTAQKFLLALSNKLKKEFNLEYQDKAAQKDVESEYKNEIALLVEWGMKKSELIHYIKENKPQLEGKNSDQVIQHLLKAFRR